jgi:hypothetical protein
MLLVPSEVNLKIVLSEDTKRFPPASTASASGQYFPTAVAKTLLVPISGVFEDRCKIRARKNISGRVHCEITIDRRVLRPSSKCGFGSIGSEFDDGVGVPGLKKQIARVVKGQVASANFNRNQWCYQANYCLSN